MKIYCINNNSIYRYLLFLILFICAIIPHANSQVSSYRIKYLTYKEGLTNANVHDICQDNNGFIWIGTEGGLFRYDGFRIRNYQNNIEDTTSINSNFVYNILDDTCGNLWIATHKGLMLCNEEYDNFIDLNLSKRHLSGKPGNIRTIYEIPDLGILVGGNDRVLILDPETQNVNEEKTKWLKAIVKDNADFMSCLYSTDKRLWIGSKSGLYIVDVASDSVEHVNLTSFTGIPNSNSFFNHYQDRFDDIWITSWWGDKKGDDGFAKLWKMMYERFVNHHQLNNLIWVWNANAPRDRENDEAYAYDLYFPGTEYVDVLAAGVYHNDYRQVHHDQLLELGKGKVIAPGEVGEAPTPEILDQQPMWPWFMIWSRWVKTHNTPEKIKNLYNYSRTKTHNNN